MRNAVIFIDVDLTLIDYNGDIIDGAIEMVKALGEKNTQLYLWSTAGKEYCINVAKNYGIDHLFEGFCSKPDIIVDDMPQTCTDPFVFNPNSFESLTELTKSLINNHID